MRRCTQGWYQRKNAKERKAVADAHNRALANLRAEQQRLYDLVRHQRSELHQAGLITDEEYADLVSSGSESARRLESYDQIRKRLAQAEQEKSAVAEAMADKERKE